MIKIYISPSCSSCRKVKEWFECQNIPHELINIFSGDITKDDIKECLEEDGFLPSDKNVDLVMQAAREGLSDCNDDEWN